MAIALSPPARPLSPPGRPLLVPATKHEQHDATVLDGLRLRYIDVRPRDESGPPVVLLHGLASRLEEYEDLVDRLRPNRRIVVMDLPGNGYSDKPERPYTLSFLEDAVLSLLDQLDIREADVAGGSLGGHLTLRLGHRAPGLFRKLVPWAPAGVWEPMRTFGRLVGSIGARFLFWPVVWVQSRFWYNRAWKGRERALAEAFQHLRETHHPSFRRMYFDLAREQLLASLFPIAPSIAQPTLVLWGDQDHALGMGKGVKRLVRLLPNARLRVFAGARHSLANEVPEELAQNIDAFLT
jgi:2-hydroxy-6-oxonona-2,4-dienedioate hydrolase